MLLDAFAKWNFPCIMIWQGYVLECLPVICNIWIYQHVWICTDDSRWCLPTAIKCTPESAKSIEIHLFCSIWVPFSKHHRLPSRYTCHCPMCALQYMCMHAWMGVDLYESHWAHFCLWLVYMGLYALTGWCIINWPLNLNSVSISLWMKGTKEWIAIWPLPFLVL